jgi:hypothetical protein
VSKKQTGTGAVNSGALIARRLRAAWLWGVMCMLIIALLPACSSKRKVSYGSHIPGATMAKLTEEEPTQLPKADKASKTKLVYTRKLAAGQLLRYKDGLPACKEMKDLTLVLDLVEQRDFKAYKLLLASKRCKVPATGQEFFVVEQSDVAAKCREKGSLDNYWLWKADLVE